MWDYRVGEVDEPRTCGSPWRSRPRRRFPPFLSRSSSSFDDGAFVPGSGTDLETSEYQRKLVLTDGGVYDNLGLEPVWKSHETVLVSDGGGKLKAKPKPRARLAAPVPARLRRRSTTRSGACGSARTIDGYKAGLRKGTYWGIRSNVDDFALPDALPCPFETTTELANEPTRLAKVDARKQERLINWGYAVCDTAMRKHVVPGAPAPDGFPYEGGVA